MTRLMTTLTGASLLVFSSLVCAAVPEGWSANGSALSDYSVATDKAVTYQGHPSVAIASKNANSTGFAGLMQMISADDYKGKRVRLAAYLKTRDVAGGGAHLWFRVDGTNGKVLGFDNMYSRPVRGTTAWTKYEIVLDVPEDSTALAYGFFLNGGGVAWATSFGLEVVSDSVPTTSRWPTHPTNLNFDQ